jgi:hypothetical protein
MENIWKMIINSFNYFNIFRKNNTNETKISEDIDKLEDIIVDTKIKSPMQNYLIHNDPNIMSDWDYLVRLHIR